MGRVNGGCAQGARGEETGARRGGIQRRRLDRVQAGEERGKLAVIASLVGKGGFEIWRQEAEWWWVHWCMGLNYMFEIPLAVNSPLAIA